MEKPPPYSSDGASLKLPAVPSGLSNPPIASPEHIRDSLQQQRLPTRPWASREQLSSPRLSPPSSNTQTVPSSTGLDLPRVPSHAPGMRPSLPEPTPRKRDSSASLDDPDDRTAAEALLGLGRATKQGWTMQTFVQKHIVLTSNRSRSTSTATT